MIDGSHIFKHPHRASRPDHMVIILRGLPGIYLLTISTRLLFFGGKFFKDANFFSILWTGDGLRVTAFLASCSQYIKTACIYLYAFKQVWCKHKDSSEYIYHTYIKLPLLYFVSCASMVTCQNQAVKIYSLHSYLQVVERAIWQRCCVILRLKMAGKHHVYIPWMSTSWLKLKRSAVGFLNS